MNWYKVASFPHDIDLSEVHQYFDQQGLVHRFTESNDQQELWIADEHLVEGARSFITAWQQGELQLDMTTEEPPRSKATWATAGTDSRGSVLRQYPLTLIIVALGIVGYLITDVFRHSGWLSALTFQHFRATPAGLMFDPVHVTLQRGEVWRLLTPTFLHFNLLHIVFNGLWIWEFGRRLERYFSTTVYLLIFFGTAVGANIVQYLSASNVPFGGLSGVVYGYLGVLFVAHRIAPHPVLAVPPGIFIFMLAWLALGVFGVIDMFIPGPAAVGNGAHLGGLLFGLILGYGFIHRKNPT